MTSQSSLWGGSGAARGAASRMNLIDWSNPTPGGGAVQARCRRGKAGEGFVGRRDRARDGHERTDAPRGIPRTAGRQNHGPAADVAGGGTATAALRGAEIQVRVDGAVVVEIGLTAGAAADIQAATAGVLTLVADGNGGSELVVPRHGRDRTARRCHSLRRRKLRIHR